MEYTFFGKEARFHHFGLAVRSIRAVCPSSEPIVESAQGVSLAFISLHGVTLELLEPFGDNSHIQRSLESGTKLLHLSFEVPTLDDALKSCRPHGFHPIRGPEPAAVFDNRRIVWVFSKHYGLFELVEQVQKAEPESKP